MKPSVDISQVTLTIFRANKMTKYEFLLELAALIDKYTKNNPEYEDVLQKIERRGDDNRLIQSVISTYQFY